MSATDTHVCGRCGRGRDPNDPKEAARCWNCQTEEPAVEKAEPQCDIEASARKLEAAVQESGHSEPVLTCGCIVLTQAEYDAMDAPPTVDFHLVPDASHKRSLLHAKGCEEIAAAEKRGGDMPVSDRAEVFDAMADAETPLTFGNYLETLRRIRAKRGADLKPCEFGCGHEFSTQTYPNGPPPHNCVAYSTLFQRAQEARDALRVKGEHIARQFVTIYAAFEETNDVGEVLIRGLPRRVTRMTYEQWVAGEEFLRLSPLSWGAPPPDETP